MNRCLCFTFSIMAITFFSLSIYIYQHVSVSCELSSIKSSSCSEITNNYGPSEYSYKIKCIIKIGNDTFDATSSCKRPQVEKGCNKCVPKYKINKEYLCLKLDPMDYILSVDGSNSYYTLFVVLMVMGVLCVSCAIVSLIYEYYLNIYKNKINKINKTNESSLLI